MKRSTLLAAPLFLLSAAGCVPATGVQAPFFAELSVPADVELAWDIAYNDQDDGIGALVLLDFLVYNTDTGAPMDNIQVELMSNWGGTYLIPRTAVKTEPYPDQPDTAECDSDNDGVIDADAPDACSWYWDSSGDQYFEIASDYASAYQPTYLLGATDQRGILRAYTYVDSLPIESGSSETGDYKFGDVGVYASIGYSSDVVTIGTGTQ